MRNQLLTLINSSAICGVISIHCVRQSRASERFPSINNWAAFLRFNARRLHITDAQMHRHRQIDRQTDRQTDSHKLLNIFLPSTIEPPSYDSTHDVFTSQMHRCTHSTTFTIPPVYTMGHKKWVSLCWTITVMHLVDFNTSCNLYQWKEEWMLYRGVTKFTTLP